MNRREFHKSLFLLALSMALRPNWASGSAITKRVRERLLLASRDGRLLLTDFSGKNKKNIQLGWKGAHGLVTYDNGRKALVVGKIDGMISSIDLEKFKLLSTTAPSKGKRFYGHAAVAGSTGRFVCSEADENGDGFLVFRDLVTLQPHKEIPSFGKSPHDLAYFEKSGSIAVCHAVEKPGSFSNITFIDATKGDLIRRIKAEEKNCIFGHFYQPVDNDKLFISTQKFTTESDAEFHRMIRLNREAKSKPERIRLSKLLESLKKPAPSHSYLVNEKYDLIRMPMGESFKHSISGFSVAGWKHVAVATHAPSNGVAFFDIENRKLIAFTQIVEEPAAISALDNGDFIVTTTAGTLWKFRAPEYTKVEKLFKGIQSEHSALV